MASIGAQLRDARLARQLTVTEVAERTKIAPILIERIEADDDHRVPGGIFMRGYLRALAREVGLEPEAIVRQFLATHSPSAADDPVAGLRAAQAEEDARSVAANRQRLLTVSSCVVALILLVWLHGTPTRHRVVVVDTGSEPTAGDRYASLGLTATAEPLIIPAADHASALTLDIETIGPVWMEVNVDGLLIARRLFERGERLHVNASSAVQWLIGDAAAIRYGVNGERAASPGGPGEVRRLTITPANYRALLRDPGRALTDDTST